MPAEMLGREFREANLASRYPFADAAGLETRDGLRFGADWLVDASIGPIPAAGPIGLTSVVTAPGSAILRVGDASSPAWASARFDPAAPPERVALADPGGRPAGLLVLNPIAVAALQSWPAGTHPFADGAAEFVASAVVPAPPAGLLGLAEASGETLTGEVWLVGESGVVLTGDPEAGTVRVDVVGDPLNVRRACAGLDGQAAGSFVPLGRIIRINNVRGDRHGAFVFAPMSARRGGTILRVTTEGDDTLVFSLAGPSGASGA